MDFLVGHDDVDGAAIMMMKMRMTVMNRFTVNPHEQSPLRFSYTGKLI